MKINEAITEKKQFKTLIESEQKNIETYIGFYEKIENYLKTGKTKGIEWFLKELSYFNIKLDNDLEVEKIILKPDGNSLTDFDLIAKNTFFPTKAYIEIKFIFSEKEKQFNHSRQLRSQIKYLRGINEKFKYLFISHNINSGSTHTIYLSDNFFLE